LFLAGHRSQGDCCALRQTPLQMIVLVLRLRTGTGRRCDRARYSTTLQYAGQQLLSAQKGK
jgi:hypothetical protein